MTKYTTILIAIILSLSAAQSIKAEPIISEKNSIIVSFSSWASEVVTLSIFDEAGTEVYSDRVLAGVGDKRYTLSNLPDGDYLVTTASKLKKEEQVVTMTRGEVERLSPIATYYQPIITTTDTYVDVNYMTGDNAAVVRFYDDEGHILYKETAQTPTISKRYSIKDLPAGTYSVSVSNGKTRKVEVFER